jgi:tRNA-splicing endonuclease subunit Sen2
MNRVISQVKKKLILVYVDVPSPMGAEAEKGLRIDEILGRYTVREFVMRRWLSNRERK